MRRTLLLSICMLLTGVIIGFASRRVICEPTLREPGAHFTGTGCKQDSSGLDNSRIQAVWTAYMEQRPLSDYLMALEEMRSQPEARSLLWAMALDDNPYNFGVRQRAVFVLATDAHPWEHSLFYRVYLEAFEPHVRVAAGLMLYKKFGQEYASRVEPWLRAWLEEQGPPVTEAKRFLVEYAKQVLESGPDHPQS